MPLSRLFIITEDLDTRVVTNYKKKKKKKKNSRTLLILAGITYCKWLVHRPISTKEFDFIRDCKISHQLWKEVKVGRTKTNPRRKYYKTFCEYIRSLKIAIHVGWGIFVTTCILLVFICGNYLCQGNLRTVAYVIAQILESYSTKVVLVENRNCYNEVCISATQPRHLSNCVVKIYSEYRIWLNLIDRISWSLE